MKNLKQVLKTLIVLIVISTFTSSLCCNKPELCKPFSSDIIRSIDEADADTSSAYYNQVVANFKFTQTTTTNTPPNSCTVCPATSYAVTLQITNTTNKTIHFGYSISFVLNYASWNYQDVATISPNGTVDVGQISTNSASVSLGQFAIQSTNINYQ